MGTIWDEGWNTCSQAERGCGSKKLRLVRSHTWVNENLLSPYRERESRLTQRVMLAGLVSTLHSMGWALFCSFIKNCIFNPFTPTPAASYIFLQKCKYSEKYSGVNKWFSKPKAEDTFT